jgi:hypothetical protein
MPEFRPYNRNRREWWTMFRRLALILSVIALGLLLDGCTKCGPIWDDWLPKSCKSDHL